MSCPRVTTVDFETEAIRLRPHYPPRPVSVGIKRWGRKTKRLYWGHPEGNNCTREQAVRELRDVWREDELLCQHAKFDLDVAETHLGLRPPPWDRVHDTKYLIFFNDPYAPTLKLKESAERILSLAPETRDRLREWVIAHVPEARKKPSEWGAYISRAPARVVDLYLEDDCVKAETLFQRLWASEVEARGMREAYDRERRLMPILLENERQGVRVDLPRLERDYLIYQHALGLADAWLRRRLGLPKDANIDSDQLMARAFAAAKVVTGFKYTAPSKTFPAGQPSVSGKNLTPDMFMDKQVCSAYAYRNKLKTCLSNFFEPWLLMARETNGVIYTSWNQVRASENTGTSSEGARSGRMSNNPSLSNVPKSWEKAAAEGYVHPSFLKALPPLPLMRVYFLPDKGGVWGRRDYNQQELRLLAHFEDGPLMARYNENPRLDIHQEVRDGFAALGIKLVRRVAKDLNFGDIYGQGTTGQAQKAGLPYAEMRRLRAIKDAQILPGVAKLRNALMALWRQGGALRTLGGREYLCEKPHYSKKYKRQMTFEYKALNYLIQSSAADQIKQSIIDYHEHPQRRGRWLTSVHDENNSSLPKSQAGQKHEMHVLREAMENAFRLDVPVLSDGETGPTWGELEKYKD